MRPGGRHLGAHFSYVAFEVPPSGTRKGCLTKVQTAYPVSRAALSRPGVCARQYIAAGSAGLVVVEVDLPAGEQVWAAEAEQGQEEVRWARTVSDAQHSWLTGWATAVPKPPGRCRKTIQGATGNEPLL